MLHSLNAIFQIFGAPIIVPIIIFIIALCLRIKVKTAMMSAFYAGVGLTGFTWIIAEFTPVVTKIIRQMVENTGIKLPVVDIGWQAGSLAAFGSTVGLAFFVFGLLTEIFLFAIGVTKVFLPSNIWNNFGYMVWGTLAFYVTHNFWLSLGLEFFMLLYSLALAEIQADRWADYYGIDNTTVDALHNIEQVIPIIILDPLWNLLGFNKVKLTPKDFKRKLGVFGEPITMGIALGLIIGLLANFNSLGNIKAWAQILRFAIELGAVMEIFPLVTNVFAKAFTPLAKEINAKKKLDAQQSRYAAKRWFLAVDDGVGYGESATLIAGIILIPLTILLAFILPGNKTLPIVDLIAIPYMIESIVALTRGNILKIIATSIVWFSFGLYAASWLGPYYTAAVTHYGTALPTGVVMVTSFNLIARPLNALVFAAFISQSPIWITIAIVIYLVLLFSLRKYRSQIWHYLNRMADKNK